MTKNLKATRQESGHRLIKEIQISVPEAAYELLKDYEIEIIDQEVKERICSIYLVKDREDKYSVTFKPMNNASYANAIKELMKKIQED